MRLSTRPQVYSGQKHTPMPDATASLMAEVLSLSKETSICTPISRQNSLQILRSCFVPASPMNFSSFICESEIESIFLY